MRKISYLFTLFFTAYTMFAQVGVHDASSDDFTTTPIEPDAVLEVRSNSKALLIPRLSTSAIDNLTGEEGMIVFDTTIKCYKGYGNAKWQILGSDCITPNGAPSASDLTTVAPNGSGDYVIQVGQTLTPLYTFTDPDGDAESNSVIEWFSATDNTGSNNTSLGTASTYTTTSTDLGKFIRFCVTPSDGTNVGNTECAIDWVEVIVATTGVNYKQDFDSNTNWGYTPSPTPYNVNNDVWDIVNNMTSISTLSGNFWGMRDLENTDGGGNFRHDLTFDDVDLSGENNVVFSFDYESQDMNTNSDRYGYELFYDNISQGEVNLCVGCDVDRQGTVSINVPDTVNTFSVKLYGKFDGGNDLAAYDNIQITN